MNVQTLEKYVPILRAYDIAPKYVEEYGKVVKVYGEQGIFALKKLENGSDLLHTIHYLREQNFRGIIPLFYTKDGRFIVFDYYLMAWLEQTEVKAEHYHFMFATLGKMHKATEKDSKTTLEELEKEYEKISLQWQMERELLDNFIDECEQKWYMSPFELYFCSYYHQTIRSHEFAVSNLKEWYQLVKEKQTLRTVLNHGNLFPEHFLLDKENNGYFIALEKAHEATPIHDLVQFYYRSLYTLPTTRTERFDWLLEYEKNFPLEREEKKLMLSYLAYPQHMINLVKKYRQQKEQLKQTGKLQKISWLMNNIEQLVTQIQQHMVSRENLS